MNRKLALLVLPFLLSFSITFAAAATTTFDIQPPHDGRICLNDTTMQHTWIMYDNTEWQLFRQNHTCALNCSDTLMSCRYNEFDQLQLVMVIIVSTFIIGGIGLYFGIRVEGIDFPLYAFQMLYLAFIGFYMDVFVAAYQTVIGAMTFVPVGFLLMSLWLRYKRKREDKQGADIVGRYTEKRRR